MSERYFLSHLETSMETILALLWQPGINHHILFSSEKQNSFIYLNISFISTRKAVEIETFHSLSLEIPYLF